MIFDQTQHQSSEEQVRARDLSLKRLRPPVDVPGYEPKRFLGAGAFGEVWVALDTNTGRQVAIKFYAHRSGLDTALLSSEVEKLAFLSADRYVVQLLDVGWDAEPPYYVMEYIERGSLEDLLRLEGRLGVAKSEVLFRDVAVGLMHAHGKGVLHCDLKPANVLLDQDTKPRLADFGQSRLTHEQTPALGTLFYMAPEQADPKAVPDVRWDVYALGSLLYCMLTGTPPHRSEDAVTEIETAADLDERLARYRKLIDSSPPPTGHRQVSGVDRALAEIVDRCLAIDREQRYPNVQAVLDALSVRDVRRARRPLVMLGAVGPALVLAVMSLFAWQSFEAMLKKSDNTLRKRALDSNLFAAKYVAKTVTNELERRYTAVEEMAASQHFQGILEATLNDPELARLRAQLNDPDLPAEKQEVLRAEFVVHPARQALQHRLEKLRGDISEPEAASWFVTDAAGLQLARAPDSSTIGYNFAWRSYFSGDDHPQEWRAKPDEHITKTNLSNVFLSVAANRWSVAISTPIVREEETASGEDESDGRFLGIMGMTIEVGRFIDLNGHGKQFAVLVDMRSGPDRGLILEHPLFEQLIREHGQVPDRFLRYRLQDNQLPDGSKDDSKERREHYVDPLGEDAEGAEYNKHWLAEMAIVGLNAGNTGWKVIVQESYDQAIGRTLDELRSDLLQKSVIAMVLIAVLSTVLWGFVIRVLWAKAT
jgi:eukaryotic-like serine/threonine-protein kinase